MVSQFPAFIRQRHTLGSTRKRIHGVQQLYLRKIRTKLSIPSETLANTWRGSSEIIRKYTYNNTEILSFLSYDYQPIGVQYVPIVSWKISEGVKQRYKLWKDVGEIVYAPLYSGESIPAGFAIEIWNTNNNPITIGEANIFLSKLILTQLDLCTCALVENNRKLNVITDQGSGILDELGNIILGEGGGTLQPE